MVIQETCGRAIRNPCQGCAYILLYPSSPYICITETSISQLEVDKNVENSASLFGVEFRIV